MSWSQINDPLLRLACENLLTHLELPHTITSLERFLDTTNAKNYETYLVTTTSNRKFIMKRTKDYQEKDVYTKVLTDSSFSVPHYYGDLTQAESKGEILYMLMEYIPGNDLQGADLDTLIQAVKNLATIHSHFLGQEPPTILKFDLNQKLGLLQRDYRALSSVPKQPFKDFALMYELYMERVLEAPRTLIHNDLLPFNILTDHTHTYLIDWSHAHYSPYMLDMARLTGHHSSRSKSWFVPEAYHPILEKIYFEEMKKNPSFGTSFSQYLLDIKLAKFKERVQYLIWCIRNPNQAPDEAYYELDFEQCQQLTKKVLG